MSTKMHEIKALTGVRGIAALWVVIYHVHLEDIWPAPLGTLLIHGYLAVDLFFLLSGFVMALSYEKLYATGWNAARYGVFLLRRIARIYPLYLAVLLFVMATVFFLGSHPPLQYHSLASMSVTNLLMVQGWGLDGSFNPPSWSVSAEFGAYLLFPLITMLALTSRPWVAVGTVLACVVAIYLLSHAPTPEGVDHRRGPLNVWWVFSPLTLVRCVSEFTIGVVLYRLSKLHKVQAWAARGDVAMLVSAALLVLLMVPNADVPIVAAMAAFILVLGLGEHGVSRFMSSRPIFFLGEISYAMYLLHFSFQRVRVRGVPMLEARGVPYAAAEMIALMLLYGGLIVVSALAYWKFEKPMRNRIRHAERFVPGALEDPALQSAKAR